MNNVSLMGRLTSDVELKKTPDGTSVASFSLAVRRPHTSDKTDFLNCVAWRQTAEFISMYFGKGDMLALTGYMIVRKWQDKEGNNRSTTEIVADNAEFCGKKASNGEDDNRAAPSAKTAPAATESAGGDFELIGNDDMPF